MFDVTFTVPPGIQGLSSELQLGFEKGMSELTQFTQLRAQQHVHSLSGKLSSSITGTMISPLAGEVVQQSDIAPYGSFVEYGTGLYGPKGGLIYPQKATYMSWVSNGKNIWARHTKGMKAEPFMHPAYEDAKEAAPELIMAAISTSITTLGG